MENLEKSWNLKKVFPGLEMSWKTRKMPKVMKMACQEPSSSCVRFFFSFVRKGHGILLIFHGKSHGIPNYL